MDEPQTEDGANAGPTEPSDAADAADAPIEDAGDGARPRGRDALLALGAFGIYLAASILIWGLPALLHLDRVCVGVCSSDTKLYVWSMAWMHQAVTHGLDPLYSHAIWAPGGVNLTWVTTLPGPSLVMTPITAAFGPLVSENLLMLASPALAGWAAYLVCRRAADRYWPAVLGGAVFGFSTYMVQHMRSQLNLLLIFFVPLAVYLVMRRVAGSLGRVAFVLLLALVLAGQFSDSSELFATLTLFGAVAYAGALAFGGSWRRPLLRTLPLMAAAYALALVAVSPFLIKAFTDLPPQTVRPLDRNSSDLLSFVLPRSTMLFGGAHFASVTKGFARHVGTDDTAYLGPAFLLMLLAFAWDRRRERSTWLLLGFAAVPAILSLGPVLSIHGRPTITLPGSLLAKAPLLQHALPERFPAYLWLAVGIAAALWLARGTGRWRWLRYGVVALGLVSLAPNLSTAPFHGTIAPPAFITDGTYRSVLEPGETILAVPAHLGDDGVWQAAAGFEFDLARAYVGPLFPRNVVILGPMLTQEHANLPQAAQLALFVSTHHVGAVVVDQPVPPEMEALLTSTLGVQPQSIAGVEVFRVPADFPGVPIVPLGTPESTPPPG